MSKALDHYVQVQLRWRDMDGLGHLNQAVYHELLEEGRAGLLNELLRRAGGNRSHSFVVAHVDLDYHSEVRKADGQVEVVARVAKVGTSSIRLEHEVRLTDGRVAASGNSVVVAWDTTARGKRGLTELERAALTAG